MEERERESRKERESRRERERDKVAKKRKRLPGKNERKRKNIDPLSFVLLSFGVHNAISLF
jgi:hypothetical protein